MTFLSVCSNAAVKICLCVACCKLPTHSALLALANRQQAKQWLHTAWYSQTARELFQRASDRGRTGEMHTVCNTHYCLHMLACSTHSPVQYVTHENLYTAYTHMLLHSVLLAVSSVVLNAVTAHTVDRLQHVSTGSQDRIPLAKHLEQSPSGHPPSQCGLRCL